MGDIIGSSRYADLPRLRNEFIDLVETCNTAVSDGIRSPYTVTLGDEFQGVAVSLIDALRALFFFEEQRLVRKLDFRMRYVCLFGNIDTEINPEKAHGMMGKGLSKAREILNDKKPGSPRFKFLLEDESLSYCIGNLYIVLDGIIGRWKKKDWKLIIDMIFKKNNREVADLHGKNRDQIYKRRKTLMIEEYRTLKNTIYKLAE